MLAAIFLAACSYNYSNIDECKSLGTLDLICGLQNPEDFAKIPEEESLIISQFPGLPELNNGITLSGKLSKLSLLSNKVTDYEISYLENNDLGIGEEDCLPSKGPIYPHGIDIYEDFSADGNALSPFIKESSLLAVVNHLEISRIEFFLVFPEYVEFSDISKPTLFWIGCVKAPEKNTYFNDVVIANEKGDFFVTHQYDKDLGFNKLLIKNLTQQETGHVYQWSRDYGYKILNNSGGSWPNGIEMIGDRLFVSYRMNGSIGIFENGERQNLKLRNYLHGGPDNLLVVDGFLWAIGQNTDLGAIECIDPELIQCPTPFFAMKFDSDMEILEEYNLANVAYGAASVAYPYADLIYFGSYKSDRIAILNVGND